MKLVIGIDTGGTYTDAALLDKTTGKVRLKAKAATTPYDLSIGIAEAIDSLGRVDFSKVETVAISTTLATNAIIEGQGGRVGLLLIGYDQEIMEQQGLTKRLPVEAMHFIAGGHDVKGDEIYPLDEAAARIAIEELKAKVDSFAVSGYFSIMNPDHELRVRKLIQEITSAPVVCGHEITNKLNALRRVSTVVLNARLLPLIQQLMDSVRKVLEQKKCRARLMVVRGDGTLISEAMARQRPVETILSGPAASAIGAEFLAGKSEAIVVDMGGTTTDIAILENGLPWNNPAGATVGGWQTCVQAADLRTIGIGGDSHIQIGENNSLIIGPKRAIPLLRLGGQYPEISTEIFNNSQNGWQQDVQQSTEYLTHVNSINGLNLNQGELRLIETLLKRPQSFRAIRRIMGDSLPQLERMEMLGVIRRAGLTPTDVLWAESAPVGGNVVAAQAGTEAYAHRLKLATNEFINQIRNQITMKLAEEVLDKLLSDRINQSLTSAPQGWKKLLNSLLGSDCLPDISGYIQVHKPIIAIGAPVASFIPMVADRLHTQCIIPTHSEVGNAVGAAVASITHTVEVLVQPHIIGSNTLTYPVHTPNGREAFANLDHAVKHAEIIARETAIQRVIETGGEPSSVIVDRQEVNMGILTEVTVRACASDRMIKK